MTTTAGERILADRPEASAHFPAIPDAARILEDRSSEPNARFIQVAADGLAEFDAATWYAGDRPTNLHEHGHENEERLARARVAAGLAPSLYEAKRAIRRELFAFRGFPDADVVQTEVDAGAYGPVGSQGWWQYSPCEIVAESFSRGILGAPSTERTADWGRTIDHDAQLSWWKDRWRDLGVEVPAVRTFTFSLALDGSGRADAIGASAIPSGVVSMSTTGSATGARASSPASVSGAVSIVARRATSAAGVS